MTFGKALTNSSHARCDQMFRDTGLVSMTSVVGGRRLADN